MSRSIAWVSVVLVFVLASVASASPASDLLFKGVKTSLSSQDRESIAKQVGLTLSKDRKSFVDDVGRTLTVKVRELHLNADRKPEVLVVISGSTFLFGSAGSGVQLYVKNSQGRYLSNLGFPAADVKVLTARTKGYRDLLIQGPGFQCPVWRWNRSSYVYSHTVKCS
jgi:hypothetical protein